MDRFESDISSCLEQRISNDHQEMEHNSYINSDRNKILDFLNVNIYISNKELFRNIYKNNYQHMHV